MRKGFFRLFLTFLFLCCLLPVTVSAYTPGESYQRDLSTWIKNEDYRSYVEMMLDHHVRNNKRVQDALSGGYSAMFIFDGCSDHMDDPVLSDLSYYRVSGVCVVLKQDAEGNVKMVYCDDNASTIPDRPLEYGAWQLPDVGEVGPATIRDGTYQIYSVYHKGKYEALHLKSSYYDETIPAIYMTPNGFSPYRATEINVHTRTSNHTSGKGMWSAGCPLIGDGNGWKFWKLIHATYHANYDTFETDNYVGYLVIDRQMLRTEMYTLYESPAAVDAILWESGQYQPQRYFEKCGQRESYESEKPVRVLRDTSHMTLPCSNGSDARSLEMETYGAGEVLKVKGSIFNASGNLWYETQAGGYIYAGHTAQLGFFESLWYQLFGHLNS